MTLAIPAIFKQYKNIRLKGKCSCVKTVFFLKTNMFLFV